MSDVPEMVERVARAIYEADPMMISITGERLTWDTLEFGVPNGGHRARCYRYARAVIAAMREPTEAMVDAGNANGLNYWRCDPPTADAEASWRAMIDEALSLKKVSV